MEAVLYRKELLVIAVIGIFLLGLSLTISCNDLPEGDILKHAELSKDAANLVNITGTTEKWVLRYHAVDEIGITLQAKYYEKGKERTGQSPSFSGNIEGEGLLVLDYKEGDLLMGIGDDGGHQTIQTTLEKPEISGNVKQFLEEPIVLGKGSHPIGAVIMSKNGRIHSRGITDQEAIDFSVENNDYAVIFTVEVHSE